MLPFAVLLLAIALGPLIAQHHWERHYHKLCIALAGIVCLYYLFVLTGPGVFSAQESITGPSWLWLVRSSLSQAGFICAPKRRAAPFEIHFSFLLEQCWESDRNDRRVDFADSPLDRDEPRPNRAHAHRVLYLCR